jgi:hypothetical protein
MLRRLHWLFSLGPIPTVWRIVKRAGYRAGAAGVTRAAFLAMAVGITLFVLFFLVLIALWFAFMIFVWNAVLVPHTGALLITTVGGAIWFILGVSCFGRIVGLFALIWAFILFVTGGTGSWLDMTMGAGPMALYAIYCLFFGGLLAGRDKD